MTRTIKFRGKDFLGRWHYGHLHLATGSSSLMIQVDSFDSFGVLPKTVGQFTGLFDKNGNEIYEGDIYRYDNPDSINEVSYCAGGGFAGFDLTPAIHSENRLLDVEVIGNIHDNPELLKEELY